MNYITCRWSSIVKITHNPEKYVIMHLAEESDSLTMWASHGGISSLFSTTSSCRNVGAAVDSGHVFSPWSPVALEDNPGLSSLNGDEVGDAERGEGSGCLILVSTTLLLLHSTRSLKLHNSNSLSNKRSSPQSWNASATIPLSHQ